jgi:hypothetical protein
VSVSGSNYGKIMIFSLAKKKPINQQFCNPCRIRAGDKKSNEIIGLGKKICKNLCFM